MNVCVEWGRGVLGLLDKECACALYERVWRKGVVLGILALSTSCGGEGIFWLIFWVCFGIGCWLGCRMVVVVVLRALVGLLGVCWCVGMVGRVWRVMD